MEETGRFRLDLAYDGTDFSGWARQPGRRTVQGELETALSRLLRRDVGLTVAGRTDAGVHADGQVAHADLPLRVDLGRATVDLAADPGVLAYRLARMLPDDVVVYSVRPVPAEFDARFSALRRHYVYRVTDAPWGPDPLRRRDTLGWPRPLEVDALNAASAQLVGYHDFVAFCRRREGATTLRTLLRFDWRRIGEHELLAEVSADAFCHSMVRSLVGAVLSVGEGRRPADWPMTLLTATTRTSDITVAPAHALRLTAVDYPADADLAAQSARTRRRRASVVEGTAGEGVDHDDHWGTEEGRR